MVGNPDHVHLLYKISQSISQDIYIKDDQWLKKQDIEIKVPELKEWCKQKLWVPSCYHGSVKHGL